MLSPLMLSLAENLTSRDKPHFCFLTFPTLITMTLVILWVFHFITKTSGLTNKLQTVHEWYPSLFITGYLTLIQPCKGYSHDHAKIKITNIKAQEPWICIISTLTTNPLKCIWNLPLTPLRLVLWSTGLPSCGLGEMAVQLLIQNRGRRAEV